MKVPTFVGLEGVKRPFFIIEEHNKLTTPVTPSPMLEESLNGSVENGRFNFSSLHRQLRTSNIELGVEGGVSFLCSSVKKNGRFFVRHR